MTLDLAIKTIVTLGQAFHDSYVARNLTDAAWSQDLGEQIATGLFARNKLFVGQHRRADLDAAAALVRDAIMAGKLPTIH